MFLYTKQFDWEKMWAIADDITDEEVISAKAQDILDTFDIEDGGTIEKVWDMAKYVVAFEKWVKDEHLSMVASHYDGFAQGKAGVLDSMLIPAFSMLIKQGTACAVEGDMKVAMAMSILRQFPVQASFLKCTPSTSTMTSASLDIPEVEMLIFPIRSLP